MFTTGWLKYLTEDTAAHSTAIGGVVAAVDDGVFCGVVMVVVVAVVDGALLAVSCHA